MSLAYSGVEPQPSLAWQFESSNVDYVTSLQPSAQVSPGPAQLQGSAALVTNAPTSNTAVYFPGTVNDYMNLGTSTPTNFDASTSNVFFEAWINWSDLTGQQRVYGRYANPQATSSLNLYMRKLSDNTLQISGGSGNSASNSTALSTGVWYHIAFSSIPGGSSYVFVNGVPGTGTALTYTAHNAAYNTYIGSGASQYLSGYIRDLRVVQGGVVPTTSFTPGSAPFSYTLPGYVASMNVACFTLLGQFITYPSGKYGQGIYFNNKNSVGTFNTANTYTYYDISSSLQLSANNLTVSSWVNPYFSIPAPSSNQKWVMIGDSQFTIEFALNTNVSSTIPFVYFAGNNTGLLTGTTPMVQNQWFHQAVTFSNINSTSANTLCSYYFNGAYISSSNVSKTSFSTINGLQIGTGFGNWAGAWVALDDLRIYNTALTAAQVQSVYSSQGAPAPSRAMPLPLYAWDFQSSNVDYVTGLSPAFSTTAGALTVAPTYTAGKYGQAISFPNNVSGAASNSYIRYNMSIPIASFSVAFWMNPSQLPTAAGGQTYVTIYDGSVNYFNFYNNANGNWAALFGQNPYTIPVNVGIQNTGLIIPQNAWSHMAATFINGTIAFYFNGGLVGTATFANTWTVSQLYVGAYFNTFGGFNGSVDDLRIYNTALTAAQVQSIYNQQGVPGRGALVPQSPQPIFHITFEGNSTTDIIGGKIPLTAASGYIFTSTGPQSYNASGKYGTSAIFNPGNPNASTPNSNCLVYDLTSLNLTSFTLAFWLKPLATFPTGTQNQIWAGIADSLSIAPANGNNFIFIPGSGNGTNFYGQNPKSPLNTVQTSPNYAFNTQQNVWGHMACTMSVSGVCVAYFNGVAYPVSGTNAMTLVKLCLATDVSYPGFNCANCEMDDVRVYNTALTAAQVQAIYGTSGMPSRQVLTGTPLFTQLSTSATSSAVGAFSLRAVNGTTTKAVAVQAHPVATWPPIAFTGGGDFTATGTYNGVTNGVYKSRDSFSPTSSAGPSWVLFDKNDSTYYIGTSASYNTNTGAYLGSNSTTISSVSVLGEWVQLQSPVSFILRNYTITSRPNLTSQAPTTFWIAGSNDGTTWSNVHYQAGITLPPVVGLNITVPQTSNSLPYSYYRLVASVLGNSTDTNFRNVIAFVTWDINGDSPSYAPNPSQDFYADRLGNLLTAPVTGQSLVSWLGGATGYVTTWYDQSGAGNHATQATAANQPIITKATKGPGYSALFNGTTNYMNFGSSTILNGTNYSVCGITRRNTSSSQKYYIGSNGAGSTRQNLAVGYFDNTTILLGEGGYATSTAVPAYSAGSEPTGFDFVMLSQTTGAYCFSWRNGTSYPGGNSGVNLPLNSAGVGIIGAVATNGSYAAYFSGEIFELIIFTASLFDLSGSSIGQLSPIPSVIQSIYNNQLSAYGT